MGKWMNKLGILLRNIEQWYIDKNNLEECQGCDAEWAQSVCPILNEQNIVMEIRSVVARK
jgi:hypothetical protein